MYKVGNLRYVVEIRRYKVRDQIYEVEYIR